MCFERKMILGPHNFLKKKGADGPVVTGAQNVS